ncbi:hypothetical protein [Rhodococcus sp. MEB064]|uniref:hypothetical protein n=1 Tax=Rhodococcus sp. MEB064 TaxID=1587522 RepID=UPI0005ACB3FC|nr:hypothetical protein [Rhodococcus sp. MEB064]KIQ15325.1 hypothetical protein RU01_15400 [Rhodococcus sp. MEB064]
MTARITDSPSTADVLAQLKPGDTRLTNAAVVHHGNVGGVLIRVDQVTAAGDGICRGYEMNIDHHLARACFTATNTDLAVEDSEISNLVAVVRDLSAARASMPPVGGDQ